ncbi:hypothetical protein NX773_07140 [Massilia solisilvae]|uniref:Uncharacterized protein n=1 Tax=Massilia solisilvae TaxID=1811225 RepID=A0ABT2BIP2_9BURK|nr:hypothetical protein [Massilia solisilvae]MCS0607935.1 hypothetical protein [Massilia solisilvae]
MKKALYLLLLVSGAAFADDAALQKCRLLADAASRLSCYDAIPIGQATPAAAGVAAAPAAVPARTPEQAFGMEAVKKQADEQPKSIESAIAGTFDGWRPGSQIKLANGQVWKVVDGSEAVLAPLQNPKVKVSRNFFGTIFLEIEGTNQSPKVRRVQ